MRSETDQVESVGIVGASARAAAFSAIRAGLKPSCWDQFADLDLASVANIQTVTDLGDETFLNTPARRRLPLIYGGGMENQQRWIRRAADSGVLWGNPVSVVLEVRNPRTLSERLQETRLPTLDVRLSDDRPPADGTWLLKPRSSAGGRGIVRWTPEAAESSTLREPHYFQRHVEGQTYSAIFVGRQNPGDVEFVGITRQLVGWDALHAPTYAWCGSVGPAMMSLPCEHLIRRIGNVLMWKFGLQGLFGCDFIIDDSGTPWLTEVNPRYPASAEVFELACGFTLLRTHLASFGVEVGGDAPEFETATAPFVGKGVLYASADVVMPETTPEERAEPHASLGRIADVTAAGTVIHSGRPVCSFLVQAETEADAVEELRSAAARFEERLRPAAGVQSNGSLGRA
jgi:predicted ATP-grasp superfamily ATP-dependent carboligase